MTLREIQKQAHQTATEKGWYGLMGEEIRNVGELLALAHSEISEALECWRRGEMTTTHAPDGRPAGFPSELADVIIRLADTAEYLGIDLESEVICKMEYNRTRPYRHGGKKA